MKISFLFIFSFFLSALEASSLFFFVPDDWKIVPNNSSKYIKVTLISPKKQYPPSVNYAQEDTKLSPKEYCSLVKKNHLSDGADHFLDLGDLKTQGAQGKLFQFDSTSTHGKFRLLQLILFQEKKAHILTTACKISDYDQHSNAFFSIFKSATFADSAESFLTSEEKNFIRTSLKEIQSKQMPPEKTLESILNRCESICKKQGTVWSYFWAKELFKTL